MIATRQLLGEISKEEVREINKVFGGKYLYTRGVKEPASIFAWRWIGFASWVVVGWGLMVYTKFVRGYNVLWFVAPFAPFYAYLLYNWARQPNQDIQNAYKYILAKRSATCELEKNAKRFNALPSHQTSEYKKLQESLRSNHQSLYQLEAQIIDKISTGEWK